MKIKKKKKKEVSRRWKKNKILVLGLDQRLIRSPWRPLTILGSARCLRKWPGLTALRRRLPTRYKHRTQFGIKVWAWAWFKRTKTKFSCCYVFSGRPKYYCLNDNYHLNLKKLDSHLLLRREKLNRSFYINFFIFSLIYYSFYFLFSLYVFYSSFPSYFFIFLFQKFRGRTIIFENIRGKKIFRVFFWKLEKSLVFLIFKFYICTLKKLTRM